MKKRTQTFHIPHLTRFKRLQQKEVGAPPGTIMHIGDKRVDKMRLDAVDYGPGHVEDFEIEVPEKLNQYLEHESTTWLKFCGLHEVTKIQEIGKQMNIHPLVLEDIVNTIQRPKREAYDNYLYIVLKILFFDEKNDTIEHEQLSLIVGPNYLLSIQESDNNYFDVIRKRLNVEKSRLRTQKTDYLAYAIIDVVVDNYFRIMAQVNDRIARIEEELLENPTQETHQKIHALRRDLIGLRRAVWPLRDILNSLIRDESDFISEQTKIFFRDVYEHVIQIIDNIDSSRDLVMGMFDSYMSHVSHRMNEVMKVLTIIATIFIPLTFIAGIYGMNFNSAISPYNMPELDMYYGYPAVMGLMLLVTLVMVVYFKRKEWL